MLETRRPKLDMLSQSFIDQIVSEALDVLGKTGVLVESDEALRLLADAGCECKGQTVSFKENLVEESLKTTPHSIKVYDRGGQLTMNLEGDAVHFDPGSGALTILDPVTLEERKPVTRDLIRFAILTDALPNIAAQHGDDFHRCPRSHAGQVSVIHRAAVQQETGRDGYF